MSAEIRRPKRRECEQCGRTERWKEEANAWHVADLDGDGAGDVYCIHEWDINGSFLPFEKTDS